MSVIQTPRPSKRLKQRDDDDTYLVPPTAIKSEPSSPSLPIGRRLVTSGVKRFFPLPKDCQLSCPRYKLNRKQWAASCIKELEVLDLRVERTMIRDDGLVIDWSSPVPVWTDTLKPNTYDLASVITQTYEANARARPRTGKHLSLSSHLTRPPAIPHNSIDTSPSKRDGNCMSSSSIPRLLPGPSMPDSTKSDVKNSPPGEKLPVPPRPSSICRIFSTQTNGPTKSTPTHGPPQRPRSPTHSDDLDGSFPSKRKRSPAPSVFSSSTTDPGPSTVHNHRVLQEPAVPADYASPVDHEVSEMSLNYIRRYIQTYEADRASLASAYSRLATFGYRKHKQTSHSAQTIASTSKAPIGDISGCSPLKRGRLDVITELVALPSLHCAVPPSELKSACTSAGERRHVGYDMLYLGPQLGVFMVCRVAMPAATVVHTFMLQRKEVDKEEAGAKGVWPVVANVHQIVVFES